MRLTPEQADIIRRRVRAAMGEHARIWLFGSRVDDTRRGGDIDLYVEPEGPVTLEAEIRCRGRLADDLNQKVDLVLERPGRDQPIAAIAKRTGVPL